MEWIIKLMQDNPENTVMIFFAVVFIGTCILTWIINANEDLKRFDAYNRAEQMKEYEEHKLQKDQEHNG